ncbi:response regulator rcp1 [mine drainage metagenome]|uniref:Response regulator rcp1 n=1 Tax=mine drainage metagenome TaxID=410659 RepID=A0A1J5P3V9_9ZZZZ
MSPNENGVRSIQILLVEDNPGDIRLTREAMKEGKLHNRLHVVNDGVEAMEFLQRRGQYADVPRPDLILLDLNLPRMDGREVLAALKADTGLRSIPVVVLTTSHAEADVMRAYDLHANCYITKPVDFNQFMKVVQHIDDFWVNVVTLPKQ